jgi:phosphonate transport system substrate-binding protein
MQKKLFNALVAVVLTAMCILPLVSGVSAQEPLGSEANPIEVYFVPSVEASVIVSGGEVMAQALKEATGLNFKVSVPTSYAATIEAMCAAPDKTMGFIPALGYVVASNRCGVEVGAAAVRFGWPVYWAEYIVRRDSDIYDFGDLAGKTWGYGDTGSTSGYLFPFSELTKAGITPGQEVQTGGHPQTVLAVYNGEVDFGTVFFSPPLMPEGHAPWAIGDLPEPYDLTVDESHVDTAADGSTTLWVGSIRILDARANVRDTAPDVVDKVRILRLSDPIPNDTVSFGPDFPAELRTQIIDALIAFSKTDAWNQSLGSQDFYFWTSVSPIEDSAYNVVRDMLSATGQTEQDILGG